MPRHILLASLALSASLITSAALLAPRVTAGPLSPPVGPVASTYKTLAEVEPRIAINATNTPGDPIGDPSPSLFKITQPGSYYLTGNVTGVIGKHGIEIASGGVTIDLGGFDLSGVAGMGSFSGIVLTVISAPNITIKNGSVRDWGNNGIALNLSLSSNALVSDVHASGNVGNGIQSTLPGTVLSRCTASGNGNIGLYAGVGSTMSNCTASGNGNGGLYASGGSAVSNCSASNNVGTGITVGISSSVSDCAALSNDAYGISAQTGSTITRCSCETNILDGINTGICTTVSECSVYSNDGDGISVGDGSSVLRCTTRLNGNDGIRIGGGCAIRENQCTADGRGAAGGAGIHATGADNRIDGNNCSGADRGIDIDAAGNLIVRNSCTGNTTNWDIVINNKVGPIVVAPNSAPIAGNAGGIGVGSTDPWANFTY